MAEQDSELAAALDEQRRAMTLIRGAAAEVRAPLALRERLEADRARLARPRARRRWFSVALGGRGRRRGAARRRARRAGGPTLEEAAAFGAAAADRRPPRRPRASCSPPSRTASRSPSGARSSAGRRPGSRTRRGRRPRRRRPSTTRRTARRSPTRSSAATRSTCPTTRRRSTVEGTPVELFRTADGRPAATWERDGNTCVLAGDGVAGREARRARRLEGHRRGRVLGSSRTPR